MKTVKALPFFAQNKEIFDLLLIYKHLSRREKNSLTRLNVLMILSGLSELISVGIFVPYLSLLSNPIQYTNRIQKIKFAGFQALNQNQQVSRLIIITTAIVVFATILTVIVRCLNLWYNNMISANIATNLSATAYKKTLIQPYDIHKSFDSSQIITATTIQMIRVTTAIVAVMQMTTALVVSLFLALGLFIYNWKASLLAITIISISYFLFLKVVKRKLQDNSKKITNAVNLQTKTVQEGLGNIRDIILSGNYDSYINEYRKYTHEQKILQAVNSFYSGSPRFIIEGIAICAIASIAGLSSLNPSGQSTNLLATLGFLAISSQRLLPSIQQIYNGLTALKSYSADIRNLALLLELPNSPAVEKHMQSLIANAFSFKKHIELRSVAYSYKSTNLNISTPVLSDVNLTIKKGQKVGIIGQTGSGKSTLIDLIMCLISPLNGELLIDGHIIDPTIQRSWQSLIKHVPQSIYLADSTILENIAFESITKGISEDQAKKSAKIAQIYDFIMSLPLGFQTPVGERGIRLSGGQKQRIGIARALYNEPDILILDEATSALDIDTENNIMENIYNLNPSMTMIIVAHRLSSLKNCDIVYKVHKGSISLSSIKEPLENLAHPQGNGDVMSGQD